MYEFGDDTLDKTAMTTNIITMVRAAQKNKVFIDYNAIVNDLMAADPNNPEVDEVKTLLQSLQDTNPY